MCQAQEGMCGPGAGRGSREIETGGPRVFRLPAVALHTSAGAGGGWPCDHGLLLGRSLLERTGSPQSLLSPPPPQRPPMTSGSSSGTSGCPPTTMNSRPGEAGGWPGGCQGRHSWVRGLTISSPPAAGCSPWMLRPSRCASAPWPPAPMPTCWPAARAAAAAGTCGWTGPRRGGETGRGGLECRPQSCADA